MLFSGCNLCFEIIALFPSNDYQTHPKKQNPTASLMKLSKHLLKRKKKS